MKPNTTQRRLAFVLAELRDMERQERDAGIIAANLRDTAPNARERAQYAAKASEYVRRADNLHMAAAYVEREGGA